MKTGSLRYRFISNHVRHSIQKEHPLEHRMAHPLMVCNNEVLESEDEQQLHVS